MQHDWLSSAFLVATWMLIETNNPLFWAHTRCRHLVEDAVCLFLYCFHLTHLCLTVGREWCCCCRSEVTGRRAGGLQRGVRVSNWGRWLLPACSSVSLMFKSKEKRGEREEQRSPRHGCSSFVRLIAILLGDTAPDVSAA